MLKTVQGIRMDEGTDRALLMQKLCGVGHVRAEAFPQYLSGTRLIPRITWPCSYIQNASMARNKKSQPVSWKQSRLNPVGSYWSWPLTEPDALRLCYITPDGPSCPQRSRQHNRMNSPQSVLSYTHLCGVKDKSKLIGLCGALVLARYHSDQLRKVLPLRYHNRRLYNSHAMSNGRSKGEIEAAIRVAVIKFEQEFMGRGPDEVKAFIVRDQVLIRLKGVLTLAERQLAKTAEGVEMVKRMRENLIAQGRDKLCEQVSQITGTKTLALFTDIDVQIGERVLVFTVDRDIQGES